MILARAAILPMRPPFTADSSSSTENQSKAALVYCWICRYWLAAGFMFFICGLFVVAERHDFKLGINYLLLLPGLFVVGFVTRWWPAAVRHRTLLLPVSAYLIYMATNACLQNRDEGPAFVQWAMYILIFLIAAGLCLEAPLRRITQMLWLGVIIAACAALFAIFRDFVGGAMAQAGYRLSGYGGLYNPLRSGHVFGLFLVVALWCALGVPLRKWQRSIAAMCALVLLMTLLLTGSRSPLFALVVVMLLVGVTIPRSQGGRYFAVFLLVAAVTMIGFGEALFSRGWSLRPELWQSTLSMVAQHPWVGAGLGNQILLNASNGLQFYDTHNVLLAALYYGGVVGLSLFVICFGAGFWIAWSRRSRAPQFWLAAVLQVFGIATLQFDGGSLVGRPTEFWLLYWLPMALTLQALRATVAAGEGADAG